MIKQASRFFASAAVAALVACGGSDGGPNWTNEIDAETAAGLGENAAGVASQVANDILTGGYGSGLDEFPLPVKGTDAPSPAEQLLARVRRLAYSHSTDRRLMGSPSPFRVSAVCEPIETGVDSLGDPIDVDDDGIWDDYKITFPSGCTAPDGDGTDTWSGSVRLRDLPGLYAFRVDISNLKIRYSVGNEFEQLALNGFEQGVYTASEVTHSSDLSTTISFRYDNAVTAGIVGPMANSSALVDGSLGYRAIESSAFDPDGTISLESDIPDGTLTFDLDYRVVASGEEGSAAIRFTMATTEALDLDNATCHGPINGTVVGDLNGDADVGFTIDWSACDTYTVTTRGTTTPAAVAAR